MIITLTGVEWRQIRQNLGGGMRLQILTLLLRDIFRKGIQVESKSQIKCLLHFRIVQLLAT